MDLKEILSPVINKVCLNLKRKYKKFRLAPFYGGISTADCVGCFLECFYCWTYKSNLEPEKFGKFYSPKEVFNLLTFNNNKKIRISSGEPLISFDHLIEILKILKNKKFDNIFVLETNGIVLSDKEKIKILEDFKDICYIRFSLKGVDRESFLITTKKDLFEYQLKALENLCQSQMSFHVAILEIFDQEKIKKLSKDFFLKFKNNLAVKDSSKILYNIEIEKFVPYFFVLKRIKERPEIKDFFKIEKFIKKC